jgi:transcriptional regulator with XRE-family HTH domain
MTERGQMVRRLRRNKGLTQEQLAQIIGVHRDTIGNIEIGVYKNPSLRIARRLADALGISPGELLQD